MNEFELMKTFVRIVERGSLSAVAREGGMGQPTVSRQLKELEAHLGIVLMQRTTRQMQTTEAGALYYEKAKRILALTEEARESVRDIKANVSGLLRISCTSAFGIMHLTSIVFSFQREHPNVRIELSLSDRLVDLVEEGIDMAIRLGPLSDSSLIASRLGEARRLFVAAPAYIDRYGLPVKLSDLAQHNYLRFWGPSSRGYLRAAGPSGEENVEVKGNFQTDHALAIREAFLAGHGIGAAHEWLVADLIAEGHLQSVLRNYQLSTMPLSVLTPRGHLNLTRTRLFVEYLKEHVHLIPGVLA